ncbi:hypothetical protein OG330_31165 (plasmid) [Streptomyces albidoflavus]|uniref:Uncharacterized protein n=1 Tax=Streptomyces albidoflavus TaxID=1886 RepID=A0A8G1ZQW4_9ACTN|nr:hypothetical protein [Streptomyces albidoflavus]RZE15448.1 hypothetical protein C0Q92_30825 [Streptomyces albidoflavus]WSU19564.1 hypothetical protein OG330_31165 [Streptomyces albidoflavus]CAI4198534.1 hypothetical protein CCOS2040_31005 [Streptomyces albidoflavus]
MDDFEQAYALLGAVVGAYSAQIAATTGSKVEALRAERAALMEERERLRPDDEARVATILENAPPMLRRVRAGAVR